MINPYENVDWGTVSYVQGISHEHGTTEATVQNLYGQGVRFLPMSNYYPSSPYYPASVYYPNITYEDLIFAPNAEQHNMGGPRVNVSTRLGSSCHVNSIGSMFSAGSPRGQEPLGCDGEDWRVVFNQIIGMLQYPDAGGICINHPRWSENALDVDDICNMHNMFPADVLGIEIYNQSCEENTQNGWSIDIWDAVLSRGIRSWGFCAADHGGEISSSHPAPRPFKGRNILLPEALTEYGCLKAYRTGRFYSKIENTDLCFTDITLSGSSLHVAVDSTDDASIDIICDGNHTLISSKSTDYAIPKNATYVRVEAITENDRIFSNPIMMTARTRKRGKVPFAIMYD